MIFMLKKRMVGLLDEKIRTAIATNKFEEAEKLVGIRYELIQSKKKDWPIKELVQLFGSVGGLLLVLKYEELDIITSKAFGWIKGFKL